MMTPSVLAVDVPPSPGNPDPVGNCAYPKVSPPGLDISITTHKFKYLVGSHIVEGLRDVSISLSVQFVCGLTTLLMPVDKEPLGVLWAKQNWISVSAPTGFELKPGVFAILQKSSFNT